MKLLIILLATLGLVAGLAAGHFSAPKPLKTVATELKDNTQEPSNAADDHLVPSKTTKRPQAEETAEYAKIDKQFFVPIVEKNEVVSMVVISMAVEVEQGATDLVYLHEPKLRDEFLSVLFNHGRSGAFTEPHLLKDLRTSLDAAVVRVIDEQARQVLLTSIIKQDM